MGEALSGILGTVATDSALAGAGMPGLDVGPGTVGSFAPTVGSMVGGGALPEHIPEPYTAPSISPTTEPYTAPSIEPMGEGVSGPLQMTPSEAEGSQLRADRAKLDRQAMISDIIKNRPRGRGQYEPGPLPSLPNLPNVPGAIAPQRVTSPIPFPNIQFPASVQDVARDRANRLNRGGY